MSLQFPYPDRTYLYHSDRFLDKLRAEKHFSVIKEEIHTVGDFPSTYHFWLCDFKTGAKDEAGKEMKEKN